MSAAALPTKVTEETFEEKQEWINQKDKNVWGRFSRNWSPILQFWKQDKTTLKRKYMNFILCLNRIKIFLIRA